jgi:hypothetical protein
MSTYVPQETPRSSRNGGVGDRVLSTLRSLLPSSSSGALPPSDPAAPPTRFEATLATLRDLGRFLKTSYADYMFAIGEVSGSSRKSICKSQVAAAAGGPRGDT